MPTVASDAQAGIVADLRAAGFEVDSVSGLRDQYADYRDAVPVLVEWLPRVSDMGLKETLFRNLAVKFAKPALPAVIDEFIGLDASTDATGWQLRWAAGNTIEVLWDDREWERLREIAVDGRYGRGREMVVRGLAKSKRPEVPALLVSLLDDGDVRVPAIIALRKRPDPAARDRLESLRGSQERWVQKEIDKTLAKLP